MLPVIYKRYSKSESDAVSNFSVLRFNFGHTFLPSPFKSREEDELATLSVFTEARDNGNPIDHYHIFKK